MDTPPHDIEAIVACLDGLHFGTMFSGDEARRLAEYLVERRFPADTVIIQEGRRATSLAFIVSGTVTIQKDDLGAPERHIIDLSRDAVIGEIAFFDNDPRSATVVSRTEVTLLILTRERFDELAVDRPDLAIKVLFYIGRVLSRRLRQVSGRFVGLLA